MKTFFGFLLLLMSLGASGESLDHSTREKFLPAFGGVVLSMILLLSSTFLTGNLSGGWETAYVILFLLDLIVFIFAFGNILFEGLKRLNYKAIGGRILLSSILSTATSLVAMSLGLTEAITLLQFSAGGILYFSISLFSF